MEKLNIQIPGRSVPLYDPWEHGKMRADVYNSSDGDLTGIDCKKCRNRGTIAHPREDGNIYITQCDCMTMRKCVLEMERSGLKKSIRELTFDRFRAEQPWQQTIKEGAQRFARNPEGWLLFSGQSGCGKTHLCTAVCRELLARGKVVRYMPWREKCGELKGLSTDPAARAKLLDGYKGAEVLYIDDLFKVGRSPEGRCEPTAADVNLAFELLNHRYCERLTTIISTEWLPVELAQIDEATGSRIVEMAMNSTFQISRDMGHNYRLRNVVKTN